MHHSRFLTQLALALGFTANALAQATIHVDGKATGPGDGSAAAPYLTVQEGLDHPGLSAADTVLVAPGFYREALIIRHAGAQLISAMGPEVTTLRGQGMFSFHIRVDSLNQSSRISGFTLLGTPTQRGVNVSAGTGLHLERCVLRGYDIAVANGWDLWVRNCTVLDSNVGLRHECPTFSCGSITRVDDSIFWGNGLDIRIEANPHALSTTRVLTGIDPKFFGADDAHLRRTSPAIDAGDPGLMDTDGTRLDLGAYAYDPSWPNGVAECQGTRNSTNEVSRVSAIGSPSFSAGSLVIFGDRLPSLSPALLFRGTEAAELPLGQSTLCIGGMTVRIGVQATQPDGQIAFPFDPQSAPAQAPIGVGDTIRFQIWHRDVVSPDFFGLTGAVRVTIAP